MKFDQLISSLRDLDGTLRQLSGQTASTLLILRNWHIGAYLVEFEQHGEERAEYGANLIPKVAQALDIRGLNVRNLEASRLLYRAYPSLTSQTSADFLPKIFQIPQTSAESGMKQINDELRASLTKSEQTLRPEFALPVDDLFRKLTFSHFVELLRLDDPLQRAFYEIESMKAGWSVRELKRQIGSLLFERLGLSTDKEKLLRITSEKASPAQAVDLIKDPYVFEFLGLTPKETFRENDLETALIDHLQEFLLELGNGFCFEDRQKKIHIGESDYFVDLVFYHRKLHCHVLIELKVEPFTHANAGQLNTYLNYYRKHEMADGDNPPIGLLLCTHKDKTLVEYALGGMDENLFVSSYKVALPKREELEAFLKKEIDSANS